RARRGGVVLGICGGFQMLGEWIEDPDGDEGAAGARVPGLGLLDVRTRFAADKVGRTSHGSALGGAVSAYEIHHGRGRLGDSVDQVPGGARDGRVWGTMWHGCFEVDEFRRGWLAWAATQLGRGFVPGDVGFAA